MSDQIYVFSCPAVVYFQVAAATDEEAKTIARRFAMELEEGLDNYGLTDGKIDDSVGGIVVYGSFDQLPELRETSPLTAEMSE